jgi:uncharacterized protein Yka (UPF0111/DUF47 family)
VRAELFNHFRSAEQRLLSDLGRHAGIVVQLAGRLGSTIRQAADGGADALAQNAAQAKLAESRADDIVRETPLTVRRIPGTEIFCRMLEIADDAVDELEDAAFLAGLLAGGGSTELSAALFALANSVFDGAQVFQRVLGAAQHVHRGGEREEMRQFLEAADRMITIEHQTDEQERAVIAALVRSETDCRLLYLAGGIAKHFERAADALLRASLILRDHVMGETMFA